MDEIKNKAIAVTTNLYNASATTIVLTAGQGANLPSEGRAVWYNATFTNPSDDPNVEYIWFTRVSDTLTVIRGQESVAATTKNTAAATYRIVHVLSAETFQADIKGDLLSVQPRNMVWFSGYQFEYFVGNFQNLSTYDFDIRFCAIVRPLFSVHSAGRYDMFCLYQTSAQNVLQAGAVNININSSGQLVFNLYGATSSDRITATVDNFANRFGGKFVQFDFVRNYTAATLAIYINGVSQTYTQTTAGTSPGWNATLVTNFIQVGNGNNQNAPFMGFLSDFHVLNTAPAAAEVAELCRVGLSPELKDATLAASYTSDFSASVNGWTAGGGSNISYNETIASEAAWLKFWATASSGTSWGKTPANIPLKGRQKFRIELDYYIPSANTTVKKFSVLSYFSNSNLSGVITPTYDAKTHLVIEGYYESGNGPGGFIFQLQNSAGANTAGANVSTNDMLYVKNVTYTPLGAFWLTNTENGCANFIQDTGSIKNHLYSQALNPYWRLRKKRGIFKHTSTTNGNQTWSEAGLPAGIKIDAITAYAAGTITVMLGRTGQYNNLVASQALAAGWNNLTIADPFLFIAGGTVYNNQSSTTSVEFTVYYTILD
ncbi:MAG: hypothetical protein JWM68_2531 [Verrucomicrobiales bacterium]|nr:hypothetical protein [Verrucomicrobiales bacterium]